MYYLCKINKKMITGSIYKNINTNIMKLNDHFVYVEIDLIRYILSFITSNRYILINEIKYLDLPPSSTIIQSTTFTFITKQMGSYLISVFRIGFFEYLKYCLLQLLSKLLSNLCFFILNVSN